MSGNSLKENAIHVFKEFEYELQSVCENSVLHNFIMLIVDKSIL